MRLPPLGTAAEKALISLNNPDGANGSWSRKSKWTLCLGAALDENLCQLLARHGYVSETFKEDHVVYTITPSGRDRARGFSFGHYR